MTRKAMARTRAEVEEEVGAFTDLPDLGEDIGIRMTEDGIAFFWPKSFDRLDHSTRDAAEALCGLVGDRRKIDRQIDALVPILRDGGMSWGQIAWCVGITDEGARKRWGEDE